MPRPRKSTAKVRGLRAVIYLRVSTEEQAQHGYGLESQEDACRAYCQRHGYEIVAVCRDEGISGTADVADRPGLAQALGLCSAGATDVLVAYAQDRIARRVGLFDQIREKSIRWGTRLETVKEGTDFTTNESLLMGDIFAAFAAEERRRIAARLYGGRRVRSKRDGRGSGPLPFGYVRGAEGIVEVDMAAAPVIRRLFALRAGGQGYQATADTLNAEGCPTPAGGKRWTVGHVQNVERHETLYRTGRRQWDDVESERLWPVVLFD